MSTTFNAQRAGYWVEAGKVLYCYDSAGAYLGNWLCVEASECGVWKWFAA